MLPDVVRSHIARAEPTRRAAAETSPWVSLTRWTATEPDGEGTQMLPMLRVALCKGGRRSTHAFLAVATTAASAAAAAAAAAASVVRKSFPFIMGAHCPLKGKRITALAKSPASHILCPEYCAFMAAAV